MTREEIIERVGLDNVERAESAKICSNESEFYFAEYFVRIVVHYDKEDDGALRIKNYELRGA